MGLNSRATVTFNASRYALLSLLLQLRTAQAYSIEDYAHQRFKRQEMDPDHVARGQPGEVCETKTCHTSAARILENIDVSIEPCDDFYSFACGNWVSKNPISDEKTQVSIFDHVQDTLTERLKMVVEERNAGEPLYLQRMKMLYDSCVDLDRLEKEQDMSLRNALKKLGGWPVVEGPKWTDEGFDWVDKTIQLRNMGFPFSALVVVEITPDFSDSSHFILGVSEVGSGNNGELALINITDTYTRSYLSLMYDTAMLLGADPVSAEAELLDVLNFERNLLRLTLRKDEKRNLTANYRKLTLGQLKEFAPKIDWMKLISKILRRDIDDDLQLIILNHRYISSLQGVLEKAGKRTVANYMMWKMVKWSHPMGSKAFRDIASEFTYTLSGVTKTKDRYKACLDTLGTEFSEALSQAYVRRFFGVASKSNIVSMAKYVHRQFLTLIKGVDWMEVGTREEAIQKAMKIGIQVGYPDELLNDTLLAQFYDGIPIEPKASFLDNMRRINYWKKKTMLQYLGQENSKADWRTYASVAVVNAFYRVLENTIQFPAGILQDIVFDKNRPKYLNFGSIGFIVGHEVLFSFDDIGKQFDSNGNNRNWWDPITDAKYRAKTACFVDQYNNYTVTSNGLRLKLNGMNTQGDNIADSGGLKIAYLAYQNFVRENGPEKGLPGISQYSPDQLFWMSFAHVWCYNQRPEALRAAIESGTHAPHSHRVIGSVANNEFFAKSFKCAPGSKMNPERKCGVW